MKPFSVERPAFSVKFSFGTRHNAAIGLTLNAKRSTFELHFRNDH
jgi:DNA integrity scanning protein DisA with diadenylate cyclase activity